MSNDTDDNDGEVPIFYAKGTQIKSFSNGTQMRLEVTRGETEDLGQGDGLVYLRLDDALSPHWWLEVTVTEQSLFRALCQPGSIFLDKHIKATQHQITDAVEQVVIDGVPTAEPVPTPEPILTPFNFEFEMPDSVTAVLNEVITRKVAEHERGKRVASISMMASTVIAAALVFDIIRWLVS